MGEPGLENSGDHVERLLQWHVPTLVEAALVALTLDPQIAQTTAWTDFDLDLLPRSTPLDLYSTVGNRSHSVRHDRRRLPGGKTIRHKDQQLSDGGDGAG